MSSDVMRVRLHLRQVRVLEVVADSPGRLEVAVEAAWSWSRCPHCGFKCRRVHDRRVKRVWDQPVSGRRRCCCGGAGGGAATTALRATCHPEFEGKLTRRLARRLVGDVAVMPISAAARRAGVSWHLVNDVVRAWAALVGDHRRRRRCRVLLVDETSMRRRHRYVTVIVNGEGGELLAMVPHRSAEALSRFFAAQGHRWCAGVKVVVTDGSKAYRAAVDRHLGHATHVLDRFGVIGWFAAGLTRCAATCSAANPQASRRSSTPTCSGPGSCCAPPRPPRRRPTRPNSKPSARTHPRAADAWEALGRTATASTSPTTRPAPSAPTRPAPVHRSLPDRRPARVLKIVNTLAAETPHPRRHTAGRPQRPHRRP